MDDSVSAAIQKQKPNFTDRYPLLAYSLIKLFPIATFYLCFAYVSNPSVSIVLCFAAFLIEFLVVKDKFGMELVGLRFTFEPNENSIIRYFSRPSPFIPQTSLSNAFWLGSFASIGVFGISAFLSIIFKKFTFFIISLCEAILQGASLFLFTAAHEMKRREANQIVRSPFQEESIEFQLVAEENEKDIV
ncbi:hypothetical protein TRFO_35058 [Tritrichomonas foetus]|uniref:Golgi apparatus membrane protein TVP23 homolog n=1 Tax=Tritrichomonas foetus TaxID=1144522 RepID=A0A1J4JMM2_9EUKA|nr:hypothetical protein TRFO_35058 [Tritrichomonas foetus]|eukprot:OHS98492.1 hypothetical protein TRFO_35058 [Tritrichomonas foetus]